MYKRQEYVRFTAQGEREARNLGAIRKQLDEAGYTTPLVADIHFNPRAADAAAEEVEKVRINPGNYVDKVKTFDLLEYTDEEYAAELQKIRDRFIPFLNICKAIIIVFRKPLSEFQETCSGILLRNVIFRDLAISTKVFACLLYTSKSGEASRHSDFP